MAVIGLKSFSIKSGKTLNNEPPHFGEKMRGFGSMVSKTVVATSSLEKQNQQTRNEPETEPANVWINGSAH
jgi:hypothetical protein